MRLSNRSLKTILCLCGLTVLMAVTANPAEAIIVIDTKTGMIGVVEGQTLRINVANVGDRGDIHACWKVFDMMGNMVAELDGRSLPPGMAMSFDYHAPDPQRMELRVEVQVEDPDETSAKRLRDRTRITVEVFDTDTGKTEVFYPLDPQ